MGFFYSFKKINKEQKSSDESINNNNVEKILSEFDFDHNSEHFHNWLRSCGDYVHQGVKNPS